MKHPRTFKLDRLYHQFLKPRNVPVERLALLATLLYEAKFIELFNTEDLEGERYSETEKLTSGEHRGELFKIVQRVANETLK